MVKFKKILVRKFSRILSAKVQIVGMSATIGNLRDICTFLKAEAYTKNFRPVELTEYVKCEGEIARIDLEADEDELLKVERTVDFKVGTHFHFLKH